MEEVHNAATGIGTPPFSYCPFSFRERWRPAASLETETPFVFSVDRESYYGGERIESTVDTTTAQKDIAGFCVSIAYDDTRLSFLRVEPSSQIKNKTLQRHRWDEQSCA